MSINYPEEMIARLEAVIQYQQQHQTEIDRLWKRMTPESDWSPGSPSTLFPDLMGSPTNPGEGGGTTDNIKLGTTASAAFKGSWVTVNLKTWNGSTWAANGSTQSCYLHVSGVAAGKNVVIAKDTSGQWFVVAREC